MGITATNRRFATSHTNYSTKRTNRFYNVPNTADKSIRPIHHHRRRINRRKMERNLQIIEDFLALEENWNGNQAPPFNKTLIDTTQKIIKNITQQQPDIFPTARKSIQLEYEKDNEDYLEFEVFEDSIMVFRIIGDEEEEYEIAIDDFQKINEIIGDFHEENH